MCFLTESYFAQITVTESSLAPAGTEWIYHATGGGDYVTVPSGGANQIWNIPSYNFGYNYNTQFVNPSSTPYDTAFPTATHCVNTIVGSANTYAYLELANNEFRQLGIGQSISGQPIWHYNPTSFIMPVPLTYPHTPWTRVFQYEFSVIPGFVSTIRDSSIIELDGWGTLTTQYGTFQALRTRERHWITEWLNGSVTANKQSVSYAWFDNRGITLLSYTSPTDSVNFTVATIVEAEITSTTSVSENEIKQVKYNLSQNYPNPFNPSTRITYFIPENGLVNLSVYDVLGNEVAVLVNEYKPLGNYEVDFSAADLTSGIYFYTLRVNAFTETNKMLLLR
jgi:hypothetical protein